MEIIKNFSENFENMSIERVSLLYLLSQRHLSNVIVGIRTLTQMNNLFYKEFPKVDQVSWNILLKRLSNKGNLKNEKLGKVL